MNNQIKERCEFDLTHFLRSTTEKEEIEFSCDTITTDSIELLEETTGTLSLEKVDEDISAHFLVHLHPKIRCDRCLIEGVKKYTLSFERFYTDKPEPEDLIEKELPRNFKIDLTDEIIKEFIATAEFQRLCKEDCRGLCQECGANLNESPEHIH